MKKLFFAIVLIATAFTVNAQQFNIGLGGGVYSTWLVNKNVSDQGPELDFASTFGGQVGLSLQYYFKDNLGITTGLLFTGHNQKYTGDLGNNESFEAKVKLRYLDVPFLLRMGGGAKGAYFEFGPQFSFLMSAKESYTSTPADADFDYADKNIKENLKSSVIAGVLGFGVDIDASENVTITTGLRLGYGFTDVTKEYTLTEAAVLAASDNLSGLSLISHTDRNGDFKYHSNNRAFGGLFLSILYKIPVAKK